MKIHKYDKIVIGLRAWKTETMNYETLFNKVFTMNQDIFQWLFILFPN